MEPLFIAVLAFSAISVSRAEVSLFVHKGGSVRLDVQGYEGLKFNILSWHFNISTVVLEYIMKFNDLTFYNNYNISTEFYQKNFTLLLKNVQERDSGIYTAKITDAKGQLRDVASYRLTVQEPPPTPQVSVVSLSSAGGICKVSVNCSANDTWASYTCEHTHCTQVANTTSPTGINIIVTATNEAISCSSSNRVGTKTRSKSTKDVCPQITNFPVGVIVAVVSIIIIIIIIVFVIYKWRRITGGPGAVLSNTSTVGTVYETVTTAKPEHHPEGSTVYDTLGPAGNPPTKTATTYDTVIKGAS